MRLDSWDKAFKVVAFADEHDDEAIRQLIHQGFDVYREDDGPEELLGDVDYFFQQAMDPDARTTQLEEPNISSPRVLALLATLAANAVRQHEKFEGAPPDKIQPIQYLREYFSRELMGNFREQDNQTTAEIANELYKADINLKRPRPAAGIKGLRHRPDEHPDFDWFFEIPLVVSGELCEARFHEGKWEAGYDDDSKSALGEPNYHIDNNCIYVPSGHATYHLYTRQEQNFMTLIDRGAEFIKDAEIQWVFNESDAIQHKINNLINHGDQEDLWTDWDPQQNLIRLVRNAAQNKDDLDPTEYNEAEKYYDAIKIYSADGFGENSAKESIKGTKSLAMKLGELADSDDFPTVDINRPDRGTAEYSVGQTSGNFRQVPVDDLEDIFELPCFDNMVEELKLENSGPVRKQLYNFVRMVDWLQGYHDLPDSQREDAVVNDIHELFEKKWDWYDPATTEYQVRYELRQGEVQGNTPLPMSCDNTDMEHHCIGRRACPYSIYGSLPFPDEMYDQLDGMSQDGEYQSTL